MSADSYLPTKAFVIGPVGDSDAEDGCPARVAYEEGIQVFEDVIAPACTGFGLEAFRADMISRSGEITEQVFRHLRDSAVVIADLTGANPNVMYELGLRHTTGKLTLQLGEKEKPPFDVSTIRTIMFKRSPHWLVQARKDLAKALAAGLESGGDPVSATRIWFESPISALPDSKRGDELEGNAVDDSPGFLELLADMEAAIQSLGQTLGNAASIINEIAAIYAEGTASARQSDARGGGASARLEIVERVASKLDDQAGKLSIVAGEYVSTVDRIEPGLKYLFDELSKSPGQIAEAPDFPAQVLALCDSAQGSIAATQDMRDNALEMGKASRSLKKVGQKLAPSFSRFADTSTRVSGWRNFLADS